MNWPEYFCLATQVDYQTAQDIAHIGLIIIDNFVDSSMIFCQNRLWPCGEYKQVHSSRYPVPALDVGIYGIECRNSWNWLQHLRL